MDGAGYGRRRLWTAQAREQVAARRPGGALDDGPRAGDPGPVAAEGSGETAQHAAGQRPGDVDPLGGQRRVAPGQPADQRLRPSLGPAPAAEVATGDAVGA